MATDPLRHPGGITPPPTQPPGNPWPWMLLVGLALVAGLLWWHPWTGMVGPHPSPTPTHNVGKKAKSVVPLAVQLKREIKRRKAAEAKVTELRKALKSAKAHPVRTVGGSQTLNVKHSGRVELGGEIRLLLGQDRPSFPVIPASPATK